MSIRARVFMVLLLSSVIVWATGAPTIAVHDTGTLELDGNPQEQGASGDDWEGIFDGGGSNFAEAFIRDWSDPTDTTYLHTGGSKDNNDFHEWERTTNDEAPDKDEIMNAFAAAYMVSGDLVLYFGADRFDDEGDAQMGFWFTQDDISISGTAVNGDHVDGDVLVQSNFTNGGKIGNITVFEWVGSGGSHGPLDQVVSVDAADCADAATSDDVCALVNVGEDVEPVWDFENKDGSEYNSGEFYEGGINLTDLGIETDCFSTFIAETRTSHPFDARLKDVAMGDFDTCATKKGTKFEDLNADGDRDSGEPVLQGWTIHLFGEGEHLHEVTDGNGNYEFSGLEPGQYTVCETQENGWTQSMPGTGAGTADCSAHDHDGTPGARGYAIDLSFGEIDSGNDFGNFRMATKSGTKFEDLNADGDRDGDEPGLQGWEIHLFGADGRGNAVHEHDTTDPDGDYSFEVPPGNYTVCEEDRANWTQSLPASGPGCGGHDGAGGTGYSISLDSNETDSGNDFGNFRGAVKSGTKFEDLNADGDRDEGEPGVEGLEIHLFGTDGSGAAVHEHATTDADGDYSFDVPPGDYTVCESASDGWTQSYPTTGPDCSGHAGATGIGYTISLDSNETDSGNDFGNYRAGRKTGTKFEDVDGDGTWDEGEPVVPGVEIHIFGDHGVHQHATTDADGEYAFDVPPGDYTVCETVAEGWTQTYPSEGADCSEHGGGVGYAITLTSGGLDSDNDFGNFRTARKLGAKFEDTNADGDRDEGEPGLEGWEIHLFGTDGRGNAVHEHASTDSTGAYAFDVPPGNYTVCETIPEGWIQSYPADGADCSEHGGGVGYTIRLGSGDVEEDNDFGNYQNATKSGTKFLDADGDGTRDAGDAGLEEWQIHIFGTDGQGNDVHEHASTNADGSYSFEVPPGSYTVCETVGTPVDAARGLRLIVTADPESGSPDDPVTYTYTATNTGDVTLTNVVVTDAEFGVVGAASSLDPGESVSFTEESTLPADDVSRSASATADAGWQQTFPAEGADCSEHGGGVGYAITLGSGEDETGNDFGNEAVTVGASGGTDVTVVLPRRLVRTGTDTLAGMQLGFSLLGIGVALRALARRRRVAFEEE